MKYALSIGYPSLAESFLVGSAFRSGCRRLNRLVNNLLDQTRLESGALRPRLDWCDGHDLLNAAIDGVSDSLEGHPFEVDVPKDLPLFRADAALMEQVIANLLLNSALHTPAGTEIFLAAGVDRARSRIFFTVADRGPGLPAAMRERLFQKFQRGDAAKAGGLGLGLSIIRGFVTAQGGDVVAGENPEVHDGSGLHLKVVQHRRPGRAQSEIGGVPGTPRHGAFAQTVTAVGVRDPAQPDQVIQDAVGGRAR